MPLTEKRMYLFLFGCMGTRLALTILAQQLPLEKLPIMGWFYIALGFGFILNFIFKIRKTGLETENEPIWWDNLRPIHAFLYLLFAYLAVNKNKEAWKILFIDTLIGLLAFVNHHFL
jgi:hypothetical protein